MKSGMQWPIGIVAILAASVAGNVAFMRAANNDPSFAIEPEYYQKAVAYDTIMSEAKLSAALGWSAITSLELGSSGQGMLQTQLKGPSGESVDADSVIAQAFFIARANNVVKVRLTGSGDGSGVYRALIPVLHMGQWEIRVDAFRNQEHYISTVRRDVSAPAASGATAK